MRKMLLGAAVVALMTAPGAANAAATGYVDAYGGNDEFSVSGIGDADSSLWGADGVVAFSNVQLGAHYADFDEGSDAVWAGDGHIFARQDNTQFGVGVSYGSFEDSTEWTGALEGLYFMDRVTLGANIVFSHAELESGGVDLGDTDYAGIDGEARFFATDNFRLGVVAGWGDFKAAGSNDMTTLGANGEFQLSGMPLSIFAGYSHTDADAFESDAWMLGGRFNFGGQTLLERDRSGANLRTLSGGFGRLFGF
jgi:hypothetical protein